MNDYQRIAFENLCEHFYGNHSLCNGNDIEERREFNISRQLIKGLMKFLISSFPCDVATAVSTIWGPQVIGAPTWIAISSFVTFVLIDEKNVLDPSTAFVSITLFNSLRVNMVAIPQLIAELVQSQVSFKRVRSFLLSEEIEGRAVDDETAICNAVEIDGGSFCWTNGEPPFLRDITISVPRGSLVAVVGRVGSGKSALFSAILGEMHATEGAVRIMKGGRLAYVSQQAWIQNTTLRQNILFVKPMDKKSYNSALSTCCLKPDIKILPGGDLTEIGEKGVNLSGGQKQRVSLARAVYQDADIYLLDDPLSAVDSHVGAHIFKHVIGPEGVLQNKTRILATHDYSALQEVDKIYLMSEGRILESGTYQELLDQKGEFARLIEEYLKKQIEDETGDESDEEKRTPDNESPGIKKLSTEDLKAQMQRLGSRLSRTISRTISLEEKDPKKVRFIEKERMEIGREIERKFNLLFYPTTADIDTVPEELQLELIDLNSDHSVKKMFTARH
ncbi:multidrug resistance-associated protein 1 [Trichonephila clavipes]|nr:multidrug resistance-associated protein 1 [Trichonephila clavipes]